MTVLLFFSVWTICLIAPNPGDKSMRLENFAFESYFLNGCLAVWDIVAPEGHNRGIIVRFGLVTEAVHKFLIQKKYVTDICTKLKSLNKKMERPVPLEEHQKGTVNQNESPNLER